MGYKGFYMATNLFGDPMQRCLLKSQWAIRLMGIVYVMAKDARIL